MSDNLSLPRTSGIYRITCTANNKIYIGSTSNLYKRQHDHFADMKRGAHGNRHLQAAWNKYGGDTFTFEVLEYVMPWSRIDREQYWLDLLKPYNNAIGFNVAIRARGDKLSAEHRANISQSNMGHPVSVEARAKMSASKKGKPVLLETCEKAWAAITGRVVSIETRTKLADRKSKIDWLVTKPDGTTILIRNLKKFCRTNNLNHGQMYAVDKGHRNHHKGYKCQKIIA